MTRKWLWAMAIACGLISTLVTMHRHRSAPGPRVRWSLPENAEPDAPVRRGRPD
jgi:hypothetical protein